MEHSTFFTYSWHIDPKETQCTVIRIYGINKENQNICVRINNFLPYAYIQLPIINNFKWDATKAQSVVNAINYIMKDKKPIRSTLVFKHKLYYLDIEEGKRKKFPFLLCEFSHHEDIKILSYKLDKEKSINVLGIGYLKLKLHEQNASPILQLTSRQKLPTAGWCEFYGKHISKEDQVTFCDKEYLVRYDNIREYNSEDVIRPLLLGFDLEVNSSIPSQMPDASRLKDKIFQISCVLARQGDKPDAYRQYLLTLGQSDPIPNVTILSYKTEADLLVGFTTFVKEHQPNIMMGYNIFNFDLPYMIKRASVTMSLPDFDQLEMLKYSHARERTISWSSSAYKNQTFQFLEAEGRLWVDLLPIIKRDYKMNNYKLSTIASHFLNGVTKDPLDAQGIFKCYRLGMEGGDKGKKALSLVGKYCVKDSALVLNLFDVTATWAGLCEMAKVCNVEPFAIFTQGQQLRVFSQVYKYCVHNDTIVEKDGYTDTDCDNYVGATVFPPVPGVYDKVLPFDFNSLYPNTIIAYNISWDTFVHKDKYDTIPDSLCHVCHWYDHQGCEHDPKEIRRNQLTTQIKKYEEEMKEIRTKKKNRDTEKLDHLLHLVKPLKEERSVLLKSRSKIKICAERKFKFLKEPKGILPTIIENLLSARKNAKNEMGKQKGLMSEEKDTEKKELLSKYVEVLNQRQNALKVSANSMYGALGVKRGYLKFNPGAACTTFKGREAVVKAAESIQKDHRGVLVYGDTDSNYISFPHLSTARECWDYAEKVAEEVSNLFPKPMKIAFEETIYWRFMILTKKRYMSLSCGRDGAVQKKINKKGVLLQRRDNCEFIRRTYGNVILKIFEKVDREDILYSLLEDLNKLCSRSIPTSDFIVTKAVGDHGGLSPIKTKDDEGKECYKVGDYKVTPLSTDLSERQHQMETKNCDSEIDYYLHCLPAQVQLAERMRKRGQIVDVGTRLEYVITKQGGSKAKQYEKVESCEYFTRHSSSLELDYMYYLKQLSNPMDQVLGIIFGEKYKKFTLEQYNYRNKVREKVLEQLKSLFTPKLIFN